MKVVTPLLTEKEVGILDTLIATAAPHMSPANQRDAKQLKAKLAKAPRQNV